MFFGMEEALPEASSGAFCQILRKEVIQPQVPLRLPCYDSPQSLIPPWSASSLAG